MAYTMRVRDARINRNEIDPLVQQLTSIRRRRELDVEQVSKAMGHSEQYLKDIESGDRQPTLKDIRDWERAMSLRVEYRFTTITD